MQDILKLVEENKVVKVIAPTGYGKTTKLAENLGNAGYNIVVVVSKKETAEKLNKLNFFNVKYISSKQYLENKIIKDVLIIDELDTGSIDNFLIISEWKKKNKSKLVLTSLLPHSLFPDFPNYIVKKGSPIEIRYTQDNGNDLMDLIYKTYNSSIVGDFLVFALDKNLVINKLKTLDIDSTKRKIIVVDDKAKTYLRKTDFGCIFDDMKERRNEPTLTGGVRERIQYISKRDAELRSIRSSQSVIVYRMISKTTFDNLPEITDEEIFRMPLHHLMIDIYKRKLNPFEILPSIAFQIKDLDFIYSLFLNFGILNITGNLTPKAKLFRKLPFGIRPSLLCLEINEYDGIVLTSCIDNYMGTPFLLDKKVETNKGVFEYEMDLYEHIQKYYNRFRGESDCETLIYMYKDSLLNKDLKNWCEENAISYSYMKNVYTSIENVSSIMIKDRKEVNVDSLMGKISSIIEKLYQDRKMSIDKERLLFTQYIDLVGTPFNIDSISINLIEEKRPLEIYSLISSVISDFHSVSLSYVSPKTSFQLSNDKPIIPY